MVKWSAGQTLHIFSYLYRYSIKIATNLTIVMYFQWTKVTQQNCFTTVIYKPKHYTQNY